MIRVLDAGIAARRALGMSVLEPGADLRPDTDTPVADLLAYALGTVDPVEDPVLAGILTIAEMLDQRVTANLLDGANAAVLDSADGGDVARRLRVLAELHQRQIRALAGTAERKRNAILAARGTKPRSGPCDCPAGPLTHADSGGLCVDCGGAAAADRDGK